MNTSPVGHDWRHRSRWGDRSHEAALLWGLLQVPL